MKNYILIIALHLPTFCNAQEGPKLTPAEKKKLQDFFGVKENVKEVNTSIDALTTLGKRQFTTTTTFYKNGAPKETNMFENGKLKSTEPWRASEKNDDKGWEFIEKFDDKKRVIKTIKYNSGKIVSEIDFKYDASGNNVEEFDKVSNVKKKLRYNSFHKIAEEVEYQQNGEWYSRKKYNYDAKKDNVETFVYYYPEEKVPNGRLVYQYDKNGDMIKCVTYDKNNEVIETKIRKISYY